MAYYKLEKDIDEVCRIAGVREYVHDYIDEYVRKYSGREYGGTTTAAAIMRQQAEEFAKCERRDLDRLASLISFSEGQDQLWRPMYTSANFLSKTIED